MAKQTAIAAIDLFCGAGGLSYGLQAAGIPVLAGIDIDETCAYPFESNIEAPFLARDIREVSGAQLNAIWGKIGIRVLAGCAPCQPFSPYRRGIDTSADDKWPLLGEFGRLVSETLPDLVTMENVPRISSAAIFQTFVETLSELNYSVSWKSCRGLDYGLPQSRRRLVLLASKLGKVRIKAGGWHGKSPRTVRQTIGGLPGIRAGAVHADDPLHKSRSLSELNLERIRASKPGGTWHDWPESLRSPCHQRASGSTFRNVYARMEWDAPAPTITTLAHSYGTGRFGHPEQDRPISLREAAMLQGFPQQYRFVQPGDPVHFTRLGRMIGNAVPPPIACAIGETIIAHLGEHGIVVDAKG